MTKSALRSHPKDEKPHIYHAKDGWVGIWMDDSIAIDGKYWTACKEYLRKRNRL